jgi:hypothetical protein
LLSLHLEGIFRDWLSKALGARAYFGVGPDLVAKIDDEIILIDVIVKQAKPKKYSKTSCEIATKHGFRAMALLLDVEIKVGKVSLSEM